MKEIIMATSNLHKIDEFQKILNVFDIKIKGLKDLGIESPEENGKDFIENSLIKSRYLFEKTGLPSLADDSGFCVESLNDFPGLCSSRFSDACGSYEKAFEIISKCINPNNKNASFKICLSFVYKDKKEQIIEKYFEGEIKGQFVYPDRGENRFGYNPVFQPNGYDKTFGELDDDVRLSLNHRRIAVDKFLEYLKSINSEI
jgi:XTP/dITP diphosphohydrolase